MTLKMLTDLFGASSPHVNIVCLSLSLFLPSVRVSGDCQSNLKLIRLSVPRPSCQLMDSQKYIFKKSKREREITRRRRNRHQRRRRQVHVYSSYTSSVWALFVREIKQKEIFTSDDVVVVVDDVFEIIIASYAVTLLLLLSIIVAISCFTSNYLPPLACLPPSSSYSPLIRGIVIYIF